MFVAKNSDSLRKELVKFEFIFGWPKTFVLFHHWPCSARKKLEIFENSRRACSLKVIILCTAGIISFFEIGFAPHRQSISASRQTTKKCEWHRRIRSGVMPDIHTLHVLSFSFPIGNHSESFPVQLAHIFSYFCRLKKKRTRPNRVKGKRKKKTE